MQDYIDAGLTLDFHKRLADAYMVATHDPKHWEVKRSYAHFTRAIRAQYAEIPVKVTFTQEDPYAESADLFRDIDRGRMAIYTCADLPADHSLAQGDLNTMCRAVHDYWAHYGGFTREHYRFDIGMVAGNFGEEMAFRRHRAMMLPSAWMALACETRMQAACNNLLMAEGEYVDQKAALLPAWAFKL